MTAVPQPPGSKPSGFQRKHISTGNAISKGNAMSSSQKDSGSTSPWLSLPASHVNELAPFTSRFDVEDLCLSQAGGQTFHLFILNKSPTSPQLLMFDGTQSKPVLELDYAPIAFCMLWLDRLETSKATAQIPAIAIASQSAIHIYHRFQLIHCVALPSFSLDPLETQIWQRLVDNPDSSDAIIQELESLRKGGLHSISQKTHHVLSLVPDKRAAFIESMKNVLGTIAPHVSFLSTIKKRETVDGYHSSVLVVGTLESVIYLINPPKFEIIEKFQLSSPVLRLETKGSFFGDFQIYAVCQDQSVYVVSKSKCKMIVQMDQIISGMLVIPSNSILLATMDQTLTLYNDSGTRQLKMNVNSPIIQLADFVHEAKKIYGFMVALKSREILIYDQNKVILNLRMERPILGMRFGNFKGEETALLAVLENGSISVNILKRQSSNDLHKVSVNKDLFNFKRPAAYVECVKREKQHSKEIYQRFKLDTIKTQISLERARLLELPCGWNQVQSSLADPLDIRIEIQGYGPLYNLISFFKNQADIPLGPFGCAIQLPSSHWRLNSPLLMIPFIPPGETFKSERRLETRSSSGYGTKLLQLKITCVLRMSREPFLVKTVEICM